MSTTSLEWSIVSPDMTKRETRLTGLLELVGCPDGQLPNLF
jgi:hypothetical protein